VKKKTKKRPKRKKHMATTPTLISIVNVSDKITDAEIAAAVPAFGKQIANDYAPVWGQGCALEFVPKGQKPSGNVIAFIGGAPDVDGALGYHDVDRDGSVTGVAGIAYIKVFEVDGYDWRSTFSHEYLELLGDFPANFWADMKDGLRDVARELCDPVEGDTYEIDGIPVSNFVYPAYFNPYASADDKLDHLGKLSEPFGMSPGGYLIVRTEPGKVSNVFGAHPRAVAVQAGVTVVFGEAFPEERKASTVEKVRRKRAA